ncbi:MAG: transposase [Hyphomicrobiales bacterium]|nr:MAG: transposase [Hyphomicrobiales bacterium]
MVRRRSRWTRVSRHLDPARLVFIDETWIKTNVASIRGWRPKGERLLGFAPNGRWRALTFLAALRIDALTEPCVVDGPINGAIFRAYIEQFLLPTLRPGDIIILDNLDSHRSSAIRATIRSVGARLASCRLIRTTSTRSNRSSLKSSTGRGWPRRTPSMPSTITSPTSPRASARKNVNANAGCASALT